MHPHMHIHVLVYACDCLLFYVCVFVCVMHLQTGGIRGPGPAEAGVRAADWLPQQTTLLCATPGCPQYLKTESINRWDDVKGGYTEEGRDKEAGRKEEQEKSKEVTDRWTEMWEKKVNQ